jgi:thiol-disulfide isomerase/thioredoxin
MNLNIGPFAFQWAHILVLACALLAIGVGKVVGRKARLGIADVLVDMVLVAVATGRAVFVAQWFSVFQDDLWSVLDIRDGGFEPWSATVAALLMAAWRVRQRPELLQPLASGFAAGFAAWSVLMFAGFNGAPPVQGVPALSLTRMDGMMTPLAPTANGRAMVVNLWATWCPPCRWEMPSLARAQKRYPEIDFVFVNQGESPEVVQRYLRMASFRLEHVLLDEGNTLGKALHSSALPLTLIYGADGKLAYTHQGLISEAVLAMQLERCCRARL